ncbi:MAG: preprotein translocase subunit SecG [Thermodesulfobacteria bacterium]|nr:preprotein translocase subunit SecG [Thermodesulfobacteriota bacterium]
MQAFLIAVHVITCIILVVTVLLQQGKGAEVGAVFGSSEAIFGSAGPATLLSKVTTVCAIIFMLTSLSLTYLSIQNRGQSVMRNVQQVPVAPKLPDQAVPVPGATGGQMPATSGQAGEKLNSQSVNKTGGGVPSESMPAGADAAGQAQNTAPPAGGSQTEH